MVHCDLLRCIYVSWVVKRIMFKKKVFTKQALCLGGILVVSLRGIMECDLKTFYSSSAPSFHPSALPLCFFSLSLHPSCFLSSFKPSLGRWKGGGLSTLWLVLLAVVQLWRMPALFSMSCLIKMDQHITLGKAVLFSISLKRQHSLRIGTSSGVREIHVGLFIFWLCFIWRLAVRRSAFEKTQSVYYCCPWWISLFLSN